MKSLVTLAVSILTVAINGSALAQAYPSKPIREIVPFVAGGSSDIVARAIALKFQAYLGQPGIVENRPGANGGW